MNAAGTDQKRLTVGEKDDCAPSFSPDGKRILFTSWRTGHEEIYVVSLDGSSQQRLTGSHRAW